MSKKLLHVDSSILGAHSVSRSLSASVISHIKNAEPAAELVYRDLAASPIAHLSGAYLAAAQAPDAPKDAAMLADLALGKQVLDEFLSADTVVIGLGFYNFGIPSQLKAWIDRILVVGKTFHYTATGPVGLVGGKRVVLAIARGGFYGPGTPTASFEHAETYLRNVFGFVGIPDIEVVAADGLAIGPEVRQAGIAKAEAQIAALKN